MSVYKTTMLLEQVTNFGSVTATTSRIAGWSESFYINRSDFGDVRSLFQGDGGLCALRAALLPSGAFIVGQRYQAVNPVGPSTSSNRRFPAVSALHQDQPNAALRFTAGGVGVRNSRRIELRGIPDDLIIDGEYAPTPQFEAALRAYQAALGGTFSMRGQDYDLPKLDVLSVSAGGLVTTIQVHTLGIGNDIDYSTLKDTSDRRVSGRLQVAAIGPAANNFTLANWTNGACHSGWVRRYAIIYPIISTFAFGTPIAAVRKVGRPFDLYRGRATRR